MLRSMFSAISGLRSHQTMMDVTGNNIANVNTSGYKSTRATFQEALTQVTRSKDKRKAPEAVLEGELRDNQKSYLLPGVLSARTYLKQANAHCQTLLEQR